MKFDVISDFHGDLNPLANGRWNYDFHTVPQTPLVYDWRSTQKSNILAIAGDISNQSEKSILILEQARLVYDRIFFVTGNHDYYDPNKRDIASVDKMFIDYSNSTNGQVIFLQTGSNTYICGTTLIVGATGWYDFNAVPILSISQQHNMWKYGNMEGRQNSDIGNRYKTHRGSNDAKKIRFNSYPNKLARRDCDWIKEVVSDANKMPSVKDVVVITHTVPHPFALISDQNNPDYAFNGSYLNSCMSEIWSEGSKIKTWLFGHTHNSFDFTKNDIRFVANPRGYHTQFTGAQMTDARINGPKLIDTDEIFDYSTLFKGA